MAECPHAYQVNLGTVMFCMACRRVIGPAELAKGEYVACIKPPVIYNLTEQLWKQIAPWPNIPYEAVERHGFYLTLMQGGEYLVMPVIRDGEFLFYSARLVGGDGPKYHYQKGAKKYIWTSEDVMQERIYFGEGVADGAILSCLDGSAVALLGSYYDGSIDDRIRGHHCVIVLDGDMPGVVASLALAAQLRKVTENVSIVAMPIGKDPTDFTVSELQSYIKEALRGETKEEQTT